MAGIDYIPVTIANGASLSAEIDLRGAALIRVCMPADWDAAAVTFQVAPPGGDFVNLYKNDGTEYSLTTAAGRGVIIPPADLPMVGRLKVRSGTNGSPVNQTANRVLYLAVRHLA